LAKKWHNLEFDMKRFVLARFGSKNCCTFAPPNAQAVYAIQQNYEKIHFYLRV